MSGSGRKRISKWDLKEAPQSPSELGNIPLSFHDGGSDRHSSGISGNDMLNHYSGVLLKEPLPGGRASGSGKVGLVNRDCIEFSESMTEWDGDGSYSIKMSPGLDKWRKRSRSRSPMSRWSRPLRSRSRSRSPPRGFKRESGVNDRSKSRSGLAAQSCKDFSAGRCRKGDNCQFVHHSNQNYEDRRHPEVGSPDGYEGRHRKDGASKYLNNNDTMEHSVRVGRLTECCNDFLKGNCRRGASCRFVHHRTSDGFGMGSADEMIREREDDRKNRGSSYEHGWREPRRTGDIPCKFFAVGKCRNGEDCRFSHYTRAYTSSDGRSRDDRLGKDHKLDNADQSRNSNWNNSSLADVAKSSEFKHRKQNFSEPRVSPWSKDIGRDHNLDKNKTLGAPGSFDNVVENDAKESFQSMTENTSSCIAVTETRGTDTWLGDMEMSPEWNYRVQSPNHVSKEEPGYISQGSKSLNLNETSLPPSNENIIREGSSQIHHAAAVIQPNMFEKSYVRQYPRPNDEAIIAIPYNGGIAMGNSSSSHIDLNFSIDSLPGQSFYENGHSSSVLPHSSINAVVQSQQAITSDPQCGGSNKSPQILASFQDAKPIDKPDKVDTSASQITSEIPPMQNTVSCEQLAQLTNLSASLAQLFGNQQQLPNLYAALNPPNTMELVPSLSHSSDPVAPVTAVSTLPRTSIMSQKQYDLMCDSIEQNKSGAFLPPSFSPNAIGQKSISDSKPEIPLKYLSPLSIASGPNGGSFHGTGISGEDHNHENDLLKQSEQATTGEGMKSNEIVPEESKKVEDETKKPQENSPIENVDEEGGTDEGKKSKDVKGIRAFKFALVEFVKELLKPSWKEGQINKEAYKSIVKKVTDKVTSTIQGAHIPQTQEKIDQYLSFSKPKLMKLVQAYVEKHQKS